MSSTTVRVSNTIRDKIKNISESHGISIQDVIEKAINFYENKLFLEELNNAYAKDKNKNNDNIWDSTLMDGLEDEEWNDIGEVIKKGSKDV